MIFKDTLKSYANTPQARMFFTSTDIDKDIIVNTKHIKSLKASSTGSQASIELYPNRFSDRDPFFKFETLAYSTVQAGYDLSAPSDKFTFQYYDDMTTSGTLVLQEVHLEHLVLVKYFSASASYAYILSGGLLEKFLIDGTVSNIYNSITASTDFLTFDILDAPDGSSIKTGAATINTTAHTIAIEVANGTNLAGTVAPVFTLGYGATVDTITTNTTYASFADGVGTEVTVTALDGSTDQLWTITVSVAT